MPDMDAVVELESRRRALAHEAKALIRDHIRRERPIDQNQVKELRHKAEQIAEELEAAYRRGGSDDGGSDDGGVREPVRPRPPSRGPGSAVMPPRT